MKGYQDGRIVEFRTDLPSQGFSRGDRGFGEAGGRRQGPAPRWPTARCASSHRDKLPATSRTMPSSIYQQKNIGVFEGDKIRWTDNDRQRGLLNGDIAKIESIGRHR